MSDTELLNSLPTGLRNQIATFARKTGWSATKIVREGFRALRKEMAGIGNKNSVELTEKDRAAFRKIAVKLGHTTASRMTPEQLAERGRKGGQAKAKRAKERAAAEAAK